MHSGLTSSMGVDTGGVSIGGQWDHGPPGFFIHGTNIVGRGLKVLYIFSFFLFFGLFFPLPSPSPEKFSADALDLKGMLHHDPLVKIEDLFWRNIHFWSLPNI